MTVFYFLMAWGMQLILASAALPYDPLEYVRIPQEYQPLISTLRDIMTPDEQERPRHTFRDVKTIMDPLKPLYDELMTVPKLYALIKDYENTFKKYQKALNELNREEHSDQEKILTRASVTFESIFVFYDYYQRRFPLKLVDFVYCTSHLAVILAYPQDVIDEHIPLDLQKIFFPFYTIGLLKAIFMMCDLIIDPNKEGFFYKDDYEKEMPIVDLTDQLDQPFLTVFDQALQNNQINFVLRLRGGSRQRLTQSLFDMLDNYVHFIKPEERICSYRPQKRR